MKPTPTAANPQLKMSLYLKSLSYNKNPIINVVHPKNNNFIHSPNFSICFQRGVKYTIIEIEI